MRWLITGGCGFIGTNLVSHILRADPTSAIRIVDNLTASNREDLSGDLPVREVRSVDVGGMGDEGVELVVGDVRDHDLALRAAVGVERVVHLAAHTGVLPSVKNPRFDAETNIFGVLNYLQAARAAGCRAFVFASSGAPLGEQDPPIHEQKVPRPVSPYGASKLSGEAYCHAFYGSFGLATVALRFGNVYGPRSGRKQSVVAKFIKAALRGQPLEVYGSGDQTRDFIHVDDIVSAIMAAAAAGVGGEVFQIATHRETTVLELAKDLARIIKERTGIEPDLRHTEPFPGEVQRNYSDISKARRMLGWTPRHELSSGLQATVDWFLERQ